MNDVRLMGRTRLRRTIMLASALLLLITGCAEGSTSRTATPTPSITSLPTLTSTPTATATVTSTPTSTPMPTPSPTPTETPTPTLTPDPYVGLTIADLAERNYGGSEISAEEVLAATSQFTRTLITYPSEGLTIYGFANVPVGEGPFPVVVVLHGYIPPEQYTTVAYTTRYADALARAGYVAIHPNLRNFPPSDEGPDRFRVRSAVDVLNLIALIREAAGEPGLLSTADAAHLGIWGHSLGGGIALRVITADPTIDAAVLYGSMSGDETQNYEAIYRWSEGERGEEELATPEEDLRRISPVYHLERIQTPISIHHSLADNVVPPEWSTELCDRLRELEKGVECFTYEGLPHTFRGEGDQLFIQRYMEFYDEHLKPNS